ncbi:MAG: membrane protein insertion efficiency factor YidD [Acidobacteriota bacterium]
MIHVYQHTLAHVIGGRCRYTPSCSQYGLACMRQHGAMRGTYYTVRRIARCRPFYPGGYDPPPPPRVRAARRIMRSRS